MKKKNNQNKIIHLSTDMFADGLVILQSVANPDEYEKLIRKTVKIQDEEMKDWREMYENCMKCKGFVMCKELDNDGKWQLIVFTSLPHWKATLAHEALHTAERMCEHRNIPISKDTEELRAMLVGHIVEKVE